MFFIDEKKKCYAIIFMTATDFNLIFFLFKCLLDTRVLLLFADLIRVYVRLGIIYMKLHMFLVRFSAFT